MALRTFGVSLPDCGMTRSASQLPTTRLGRWSLDKYGGFKLKDARRLLKSVSKLTDCQPVCDQAFRMFTDSQTARAGVRVTVRSDGRSPACP